MFEFWWVPLSMAIVWCLTFGCLCFGNRKKGCRYEKTNQNEEH